MKLIGMLDSPYVRRVAVTLEFMGIPFEHVALSVFRNYEEFKQINPAVKVPTLICDNGEVLMDSSLILNYIEKIHPHKSLWSNDNSIYQAQNKLLGLALAACEKAVQIFYEKNLRAVELQLQSWLTRIHEQLNGNLQLIERELQHRPQLFINNCAHQVITTAVLWRFIKDLVSDAVVVNSYPNIESLSQRLEATAEFLKYPPNGPGVSIKA